MGLDPEDPESKRVEQSLIKGVSVWGHFHDHNTELTP